MLSFVNVRLSFSGKYHAILEWITTFDLTFELLSMKCFAFNTLILLPFLVIVWYFVDASMPKLKKLEVSL